MGPTKVPAEGVTRPRWNDTKYCAERTQEGGSGRIPEIHGNIGLPRTSWLNGNEATGVVGGTSEPFLDDLAEPVRRRGGGQARRSEARCVRKRGKQRPEADLMLTGVNTTHFYQTHARHQRRNGAINDVANGARQLSKPKLNQHP
ncbi:hypothetical protein B0H16DRAFT_1485089 [Mycena metata]|uniref:Uncharacterized protein n=1 Tax=Mycena metata TaxID=1033252 RepID=A0AAD7DNQ6_9AGAR|nr:hypothetical protein B0H16DRAFT_1485089 [Mycena metata]